MHRTVHTKVTSAAVTGYLSPLEILDSEPFEVLGSSDR